MGYGTTGNEETDDETDDRLFRTLTLTVAPCGASDEGFSQVAAQTHTHTQNRHTHGRTCLHVAVVTMAADTADGECTATAGVPSSSAACSSGGALGDVDTMDGAAVRCAAKKWVTSPGVRPRTATRE